MTGSGASMLDIWPLLALHHSWQMMAGLDASMLYMWPTQFRHTAYKLHPCWPRPRQLLALAPQPRSCAAGLLPLVLACLVVSLTPPQYSQRQVSVVVVLEVGVWFRSSQGHRSHLHPHQPGPGCAAHSRAGLGRGVSCLGQACAHSFHPVKGVAVLVSVLAGACSLLLRSLPGPRPALTSASQELKFSCVMYQHMTSTLLHKNAAARASQRDGNFPVSCGSMRHHHGSNKGSHAHHLMAPTRQCCQPCACSAGLCCCTRPLWPARSHWARAMQSCSSAHSVNVLLFHSLGPEQLCSACSHP